MNKNTGFTLIEVLIAMLVLAVGLLGLAGLQATGIKNNQSAYYRGQAIQLAYDLADRMRANADRIQANANSAAGLAAYTTILPSAATEKINCLNTIGCIPAAMAENDLFEWNRDVTTVLPSGTGNIAVAANTYTITIIWDDNRDGDVDSHSGANVGDTDNDGDTDDDPIFQTSFQL